jgi:hypothetical protein
VKVVAEVQLTAIWPSCWLCTCIVAPETAAISPLAAGPRVPAAWAVPAEADGEGELAAWAVEEDFDEAPHAASEARAAIENIPTRTGRSVRF